MLGDPQVLVLDEPANGLDPAGIRWLRTFLRDFARQERAVLVSSHLLGEVAQVADEVVVISGGRLIVRAGMSELLAQAACGIRARTDQPERLRDLMVASGAEAELTAHEVVMVKGSSAEDIGRVAAAAGIPLFGLDSEEATLEDVFFELTGSEAS